VSSITFTSSDVYTVQRVLTQSQLNALRHINNKITGLVVKNVAYHRGGLHGWPGPWGTFDSQDPSVFQT